ncbi:MAG: polysaccharide biosynthesis C-terminal domain-containing protein [Haloplanus sp.]
MTSGDSERILARFGLDVGFYTLTEFVPAALGLVGLVVFTRLFDPVAYGRYSLVVVGVTVGSTALFGWLEQAVLRFESESDAVVPTAVTTLLSLSLGVVAVGTLARPSVGALGPFYVAGVVAVVGAGSFRVCRATFQARLESRRVTLFAALRAVVKLGLGLGLSVLVFDSIAGWLWGGAVGSLLAVLAMLGRLDGPRVAFDRPTFRRLARYGVPMVGWLFGLTLLTFVDRIFIDLLADTAAVGVYASNYALVQTGLPLVLSPLIQAAHPAIVSEWSGDNHGEMRTLLAEYSRYFLLLGVGATVFAAVISRPLSTLVLGSAFHAGYLVIPVVAGALFLWNFAMLGHKGLELYESTGLMTAGIALAVLVNVAFNYALIPPYGYLGAAVATLLSSAAYAAFAYATSMRTVRWTVSHRSLARVAVAGGCMAVVGWAGYLVDSRPLLGPILAGIVGFGVYAGVLSALGEVTHRDLSNALGVVGNRE